MEKVAKTFGLPILLTLKNAQVFNDCHNGENSPNLVTLVISKTDGGKETLTPAAGHMYIKGF
jgi:hypothetical protein